MRFLNRSDVERLLDLDQLREALAPAMLALSQRAVSMPQRIAAMADDQDGLLAAMPVYLGQTETLAVKLVTVYPHNPAIGRPAHQGLVALFAADTGTPLAMMDAAYITAARTAAGSALASQLLARPEAEVLTIIGTGVQALAHAQAIPRVRPLKQIRIVGRSEQKATQLAQRIAEQGQIPATAGSSVREALVGADIVCATTHAAEPVLRGAWLEPGTHLNSVGLGGRELDDDTIAQAVLVVESRRAALFPGPGGAADLVAPLEKGLISREQLQEVGQLIAGTRPGRTSADQISLYKSVGVAVQDAVAARLVLEAAEAQGVGIEVQMLS